MIASERDQLELVENLLVPRPTRVTFSWSADLVPPERRAALTASVASVSHKTLVSWTETTAAMADLVVIDGQVMIKSRSPLCICHLGEFFVNSKPAEKKSGAMRIYHLPGGYSSSQLLNLLDLVAVWLMQKWSEIKSGQQPQLNHDNAYCLTRWANLEEKLQGYRYAVAMSAMAARPMTIAALAGHSGLTAEDVRRLISHLFMMGVVRCRDGNVLSASNTEGLAGEQRPRILEKLSSWLQTARSALSDAL